jgi:hypothetical protein
MLQMINCIQPQIIIQFLFLERKSVHASIITAVAVLSLSKAYCFNCFTKLLGKSHVVLTFSDSFTALRWDIKNIVIEQPYIQ